MWVFCCGMKRSGSTLQYDLVKDIVEALGTGEALGFVEPQDFSLLYDTHSDKERTYIVKSHLFIPAYPELFARKEALAVYSYRDLRDVFLSIMRKESEPFGKLLLSGFLPSVIDDDRMWGSMDGILRSRYEEMTLDIEAEVQRIARHLGLQLATSLISSIAVNNSLEVQSEKLRHYDWKAAHKYSEKITYMPDTLMHANHIQSGLVGEWRTAFTPVQIGLIELVAYRWLIQNGYAISQKWVRSPLVMLGVWFGGITLWFRKLRHEAN